MRYGMPIMLINFETSMYLFICIYFFVFIYLCIYVFICGNHIVKQNLNNLSYFILSAMTWIGDKIFISSSENPLYSNNSNELNS
jgi:hypothetical protein